MSNYNQNLLAESNVILSGDPSFQCIHVIVMMRRLEIEE